MFYLRIEDNPLRCKLVQQQHMQQRSPQMFTVDLYVRNKLKTFPSVL
jgi:hypothetical protein